MENVALLNAELLKCRSALEALDKEVRYLASHNNAATLPELKQASERMREIADRIEALTRAIAKGSRGSAH